MFFVINTEHMTEPQLETFLRTVSLAQGAHMTDVDMRINGENRRFEADWIKLIRKVEDRQSANKPDVDSKP